jgi:hypothetical protein
MSKFKVVAEVVSVLQRTKYSSLGIIVHDMPSFVKFCRTFSVSA